MSAVKTSALCVVPPEEAWSAVQKWRAQHDPQAHVWPPHINILYPFVPETRFPDAAQKLAQVLLKYSELTINFKKLGSFGKVAFLLPECNSDPGLQQLYRCCVEAFPELKPQLRSSFAPHLTIGQFPTVAACKSFLSTCDTPDITVTVGSLCLLARDKVDLKNSPFRISWCARFGEATAQEGPKSPYGLELPSSDFLCRWALDQKTQIKATGEPVNEEAKQMGTAPALSGHLDDFLAKVGPEFDPTFVKFHIGTDDLDELLEFTWEKNDLSPLVDAGMKPLLRNKLYRAILTEKAERSDSGAVVAGVCLQPANSESPASPTATPSAASVCETGDNEDALSTTSAPTYSASEASQLPTFSQEGLTAEKSPDLFAASLDSGTALVSSGASQASRSPDSGVDLAAFPPLGAPGKSRSVPQAKHTAVALDTGKAWAYRTDDREARRAARTEAGKRIQQTAQQVPQLAVNRQVSQPARMPGYGRQFGLSSAYQSNYAVGSFGCPRSCRICYPTG